MATLELEEPINLVEETHHQKAATLAWLASLYPGWSNSDPAVESLLTGPAGIYDAYPQQLAALVGPNGGLVEPELSYLIRLYHTYLKLSEYHQAHWSVCDLDASHQEDPLGRQLLIKFCELGLQLFPLNSPFWDYLKAACTDYCQAREIEAAHTGQSRAFEPGEMEQQAWGYAFSERLGLAALLIYYDQQNNLSKHETVLRELAIATYLQKTFVGWVSDFRRGYYNYFLSRLVNPGEATDEQNLKIKLGFSQLGESLAVLDRISTACQTARESATHLGVKLWVSQAEDLARFARLTRHNLQESRRQAMSQATQLFFRARPKTVASPTPAQALRRGVQFLIEQQDDYGSWSDWWLFNMESATSTDWVTGYVGHHLSRAARVLVAQTDPSDQALAQQTRLALEQARAWLVENRRPGGGWGYNQEMKLDADSTANCLRFLQSFAPQATQPDDYLGLLSHQHPNGGFATYRPDSLEYLRPKLGEITGWISPAVCVTVAAGLALLENPDPRATNEAVMARIQAYLHATQAENGYWQAYWFPGPAYVTSLALRLLHRLGETPANSSVLQAGLDWLLTAQQPDGSWLDFRREPSAFATALSLAGLGEISLKANQAARQRGLNWLLRTQLPDGSWPYGLNMWVPQGHILAPWAAEVAIPGRDGLGKEDYNRLFTTATVCGMLADSY